MFSLTPEVELRARELHEQCIVVDALNTPYPPGAPDFDTFNDYTRRGGVTAINLTMYERTPQGWGWDATIRTLASWTGRSHRYPDQVILATSSRHIRFAKEHGKVALIFGLQNAECLEREVSRLEILYGFGVRVIQLTYNARNLIGDGCLERVDAGLSDLGIQVVEKLNELGIVVDLSHCGPQTTIDAAQVSRAPVAATHVGAHALYPHPRNKTDEELLAIAATSGVIGIIGVPLFMRKAGPDSVEDMLDHIDHVVGVVGIDHVGIGHDNFTHPDAHHFRLNDEVGFSTGRAGLARKMPADTLMSEERWNNYHQVRLEGFDNIAGWPNLTRGLVHRGYADDDIRKILGENWIRLFTQVWDGEAG